MTYETETNSEKTERTVSGGMEREEGRVVCSSVTFSTSNSNVSNSVYNSILAYV